MDRKIPLCVDLDGTLIRSDLLHECFAAALRKDWLTPFKSMYWLATGGRCRLKSRLASIAELDVTTLPYHDEVIQWVRDQKASGRQIILTTAATQDLAEKVARHLDLFDVVISSDGQRNLKGSNKLIAIRAGVGETFDYVGDCNADGPLFSASQKGYLVTSREGASRWANVSNLAVTRASRAGALVKLLRPHQWLKNALVAVPLLFSHQFTHLDKLVNVALAFVSFCLIASAVYVLNDLVDVQADRQHHRKRNRPLASGALPITWAYPLLAGLVIAAAAMSVWLPWRFAAVLGGYAVLSVGYSFYFKTRLLMDVMVLAALYTLRLFAGGASTHVPLSPWLLGLSMSLFLSLAFAKRFVELRAALTASRQSLPGRGYVISDLDVISSVGPASGLISVVVLAMYISGEAGKTMYRHPDALWLVCPILAYWITRLWFLAHRGELHDDPVVFAATDKVSWMAVACCGAIGVLASY